MLQGYGLTECAPICALNPEKGGKSNSAGYIIAGFDAKIVDADPETGVGEICVKGENVMLGYYNNPEATAEALENGWFHTGDYGYIDKDRFVFITGRKKNVIITKNGKNVFPEELEYLLGRLDIVGESMVWEGDGGRSADTLIVATIKPDLEVAREKLGADYTEEELSKLLWAEVDKVNEELAFFKRIKKVVLRKEDFDVTTSKKIRRFNEENRSGAEI
jgi:long-subunit acyl-CoA synthetase (AMP-forming)